MAYKMMHGLAILSKFTLHQAHSCSLISNYTAWFLSLQHSTPVSNSENLWIPLPQIFAGQIFLIVQNSDIIITIFSFSEWPSWSSYMNVVTMLLPPSLATLHLSTLFYSKCLFTCLLFISSNTLDFAEAAHHCIPSLQQTQANNRSSKLFTH